MVDASTDTTSKVGNDEEHSHSLQENYEAPPFCSTPIHSSDESMADAEWEPVTSDDDSEL